MKSIYLILFLFCLPFPGKSMNASDWQEQYEACKLAFTRGDFTNASSCLEELILFNEKNIEDKVLLSEMRNLWGISLINSSKLMDGIKLLEETISYYTQNGSPDQNYFTALYELGITYYSLKNFSQALPYMQKAVNFYREAAGEQDEDYLALLGNLAAIESGLKNFSKADSLYTHLISLKKVFYGPGHPETYASMKNHASLYYSGGKFEKAREAYLALNSLLKDSVGTVNAHYAENCLMLGMICKNLERNEEAISMYSLHVQINRDLHGDRSFAYANALTSLGLLYKAAGKISASEQTLMEAVKIFKENNGDDKFNYVLSLSALGSNFRSLGQYSRAEEYLMEAVNKGKTLDNADDYANILNNLALLYDEMGKFSEAEELYKEVLSLTKKSLGENSPDYATTLNNIAALYKTLGRFDQSEQLFKRALQIRKETLGSAHRDYGSSLNNLGSLYQVMGRNKEAENFYLQAADIAKKALGENNAEYASYLNNLAGLYESSGEFSKSEPLYEQAVAIIKSTLGEDHPDYGTAVNNLALLYQKTGKFAQAEALYKKDLEIIRKTLGASHPSYAYALSNLAGLCENTGKYKEAEKLYLEAIKIRKDAFGEKHPEYATVINNLARVYTATGKMEEAEKLWNESIRNYLFQINAYFPSMSEKEKEAFYLTISPKFEQFNSFCMLRQEENPAVLSVMYNNQLATKALLLNASNKVRDRILNSGDEKLISSFKLWQHQKELLARYYTKGAEEGRKFNVDSLENLANELEKELSLKSEMFRGNAGQQYVWQDVQKKLKEGEAAVEIIRFRKYKADSAGVYSSNVIYYAVLIVKPETSGSPQCVLLNNGEDLEGKYMKFYRNSVKFKVADDYAYDQYWRRIKEVLGDVKKVYLSPDGVFNQINLYSIRNPETKQYIMDETTIQVVTNTKDIIEFTPSVSTSRHVVLLGDPAFYPDGKSGGQLAPLPGTNTEVKMIKNLLSGNKWTADVYTGVGATEDRLKKVKDIRVLHIATHGFFDKDEDIDEDDKNKKYKNPLLRSGLMLAGSGVQASLDGDDDGILTSFEAMNMSLDHVDLVVLSACETGLGEIRNGEGVYGLQRAFRVAGAKSVINSLWKVNDETTQKLMVYFYEEWLKTGDKRIAFKSAQEKIRKEFPEPYFWGAFVMVGE